MIARRELPQHQQKIGRRKRAQQMSPQAQQAHLMSQITINAVLWQIIRQNAETNEKDFDITKPAALTVPMEDFKNIPKDFGLQIKHDKDGNIIIIASGVEEKSNLILPDRRIISD